MKSILITGLAIIMMAAQSGKEKVTFKSSDGLTITADTYIVNEEYPFILLFHQGGSSRGEFIEIAEKFNKLNYNCLAVDLRSGKNSNYINNETDRLARSSGKPNDMIDARLDIRAAIDYAFNRNPKPVILLGSSYSASLCIVEGQSDSRVKAVMAFSPGEYFGDDLRIHTEITSYDKPLFVASMKREEPYVKEMLANLDQQQVTYFQPADSPGVHGAKALWESSESKDEYWLAIVMFFNKLR